MSNTAQRRKEQRERVKDRQKVHKRIDNRGHVRTVCAGSGMTISPGTPRIVKYGMVSHGIFYGEDFWMVTRRKNNPDYKHFLVVCPVCKELRVLGKTNKRKILHHKEPGASMSAGSLPQIMGWKDATTPSKK